MFRSLILLHRANAVLLAVFIFTHLATHLLAIYGIETYIYFQNKTRIIYQNPYLEPILLLAIIIQIVIGIKLANGRISRRNKSIWSWVQIVSGLYLAIFLLVHVSAALVTRNYFELDTNFFWAAGTLHFPLLSIIFTPYYFLAVFSIFAHVAAIIHFRYGDNYNRLPALVIVMGGLTGLAILTIFSGLMYEIILPQNYVDYFEYYLGVNS